MDLLLPGLSLSSDPQNIRHPCLTQLLDIGLSWVAKDASQAVSCGIFLATSGVKELTHIGSSLWDLTWSYTLILSSMEVSNHVLRHISLFRKTNDR